LKSARIVETRDPENRGSGLSPDFAIKWHWGFVGEETFNADAEPDEMFTEMIWTLPVGWTTTKPIGHVGSVGGDLICPPTSILPHANAFGVFVLDHLTFLPKLADVTGIPSSIVSGEHEIKYTMKVYPDS
jgi:hypothetical protein